MAPLILTMQSNTGITRAQENHQLNQNLYITVILKVVFCYIQAHKLQTRRHVQRRRLANVESVQVHHLDPSSDEILDQLLITASLGVHLRQSAELGVRAKDEVDAGTGPLLGSGLAVGALEEVAVTDGLPDGAHVEEVDEEVVGEGAGAVGEDTVGRAIPVSVDGSETTDEGSQLGQGQSQKLSTVNEQVLKLDTRCRLSVVSEAIDGGLEVVGGVDVGLLLSSIGATRSEGNGDKEASVLGSLLNTGGTSEDNDISKRDTLAVGLSVVELLLNALKDAEDLAELGRVVNLPVLLRLKADAGAVGTAAKVTASEGGGRGPSGRGQLGGAQARLEDLVLNGSDVALIDQLKVDLGNGVLPQEALLGNLGTEVARHGTHVTVGKLEPSLGKDLGELLKVVEEASGDLLILGIESESKIGGQHGRALLLVGVVGMGDDLGSILGHPLVSTSRTLGELPLKLEEVLKEVVAPLGGSLGPGHLESTGGGVGTLSGLVRVGPAEALRLKACSLGLGTDVIGGTCSVGLAERVASGNEGNGLLIVHGHTGKCIADVSSSSHGIGVAIRTLCRISQQIAPQIPGYPTCWQSEVIASSVNPDGQPSSQSTPRCQHMILE